MEPLIFVECKVHRRPYSPPSLPILFTWGALASEEDGAVSVLANSMWLKPTRLLTQLYKKKRQFTFMGKMTWISPSQRNAPPKALDIEQFGWQVSFRDLLY